MWPFDGLKPETAFDWLLAHEAIRELDEKSEEANRAQQEAECRHEVLMASPRSDAEDDHEVEGRAALADEPWLGDDLDNDNGCDDRDDYDEWVSKTVPAGMSVPAPLDESDEAREWIRLRCEADVRACRDAMKRASKAKGGVGLVDEPSLDDLDEEEKSRRRREADIRACRDAMKRGSKAKRRTSLVGDSWLYDDLGDGLDDNSDTYERFDEDDDSDDFPWLDD